MEITVKELHCGAWKTFTTLAIDKDDHVSSFLEELEKSNPQAIKQLQNAMNSIASEKLYRNTTKFKPVGDDIFEIKTNCGIRLYTFYTSIEGIDKPQLVLATNGGTKNTDKEQNRDIKQAEKIRDRFIAATNDLETKFNYLRLPEPE